MNGTVIMSLEDYEKMKKQTQNLETSFILGISKLMILFVFSKR